MAAKRKLYRGVETDDFLSFKFIDYFYGISASEEDRKEGLAFVNCITLRNDGKSNREISESLNISKSKINHWLFENRIPFLVKLFQTHIRLGKPDKNMRWLSINSTKGGTFTGPWIQVPETINNFECIKYVINQLEPLGEFHKESPLDKDSAIRIKLFGFCLGILIGDSTKETIKRKRRITRRITLRLSKGHETNQKLGNFVSMAVNSLGLRMKKCKDCPPGKLNTFPFFTWISQSSPLVQWMFNVCLGLKDNEKTTYDPIRASWIMTASDEFKVWFLQGLAESDGFVDFSACQVGIITHPNTELIESILSSLDIASTRRLLTRDGLWTLMISVEDGYSLPIFSDLVKDYRYLETQKLFKAKRISGHYPNWLKDKIQENIKVGVFGTRLVKKILDEDNLLIRIKGINRLKKILEVREND